MAQLLISFPQRADSQPDADPNQPPDQRTFKPYRVALNEEVLEEIIKNFAGISEVTPVLSLGNSQSGRASTLEAFLGEGNEGSFSSEDKPQGVYVWTRPVPLNNMSLLLVKMWGVNIFLLEEDKELEAITKKVMIALMSICSVCLFCGEKSTMFQSLTALVKLYRPIKEQLGLEVSKCFVFVDREATLKHKTIISHYTAFNPNAFKTTVFKTAEYGYVSEVLFRGGDGISPTCSERLLQIVGDLQTHEPFLTSHKRAMEAIETQDMCSTLIMILRSILKIAEYDLDFQNFIEKIPNFTSPGCRETLKNLSKLEDMSRAALEGCALEFFDKITATIPFYAIKPSLLTTLQTQYDLEKPIIVMVIIGNPGMGKSTLLNHIVKHLVGCSELPKLFKIGNTGTHTTRASQVFSKPFWLGDNQLMLLDLEGLDGMEITDEKERILQENLISAILTIASVPCILVRNEIQSMNFVGRISSKLSILKNYFGYKLERVHLFFHDRDLTPDDSDNVQMQELIDKMNEQYFGREKVLKMQKKPNLSDESKAEMCKKFLVDLMADSHFPKRNQSSEPVKLQQLIVEMRYITEHNTTQMSEISLTEEEERKFKRFTDEKSSLLLTKFESAKVNEIDGSLELVFNEEVRHFMGQCDEELKAQGESDNVSRRAKVTLEAKADLYRVKIVEIEYCYKSVKDLDEIQLSKKLTEQLKFFYYESRWIISFNQKADELKGKLLRVKERYPRDVDEMDRIIRNFEGTQSSLNYWYIANYGVQVITTVGLGGFGLAARGTMIAVNATRFVLAATGSGVTAASRMIYGATRTTLALNETAIELFYVNKMRLLGIRARKPAILNSKAIRVLESEGHPPVKVLLVIAAKKLKASILLNEFIHLVAPFTPSSLLAFNDSKLTQILHFDYKDQSACIIYLRMKKNKEKIEYKTVEKIAVSMIQKCSHTCLLVDSSGEYADDIITKAFPPSQIAGDSAFIPRITAIYPENRRDLVFLEKLANLETIGVQNSRIGLNNFDSESFHIKLADVKNEFDNSTRIESQIVLQIFRDAEQVANI